MAVRIGVDVGGTFTKAVACDPDTGEVRGQAVVPTSHDHADGVAHGIGRALERVVGIVAEAGLGPIISVSHSTTQAVNALLEGDTAVVGILGIGRRPDVGRVRRLTQLGSLGIAPGRALRTVSRTLDATDGAAPDDVERELIALRAAGAQAVAISEAFGVDDRATEVMALDVAARLGLPACAGHELSGMYGLELRTVTAALNAGILPRAIETAAIVHGVVDRLAPGAPLLVMRGDGGSADLRSVRRHPLLTAFSGPAASVAGALRRGGIHDGIVLEVGGTSTNISVVRGGRPILAYVRVLDHLTCVRSIDVRVAGVGGGSLLRIGRRWGRARIADVGPRSAHIASLPYASFTEPARLAGAEVMLEAPRPGDPAEYAVLHTSDGERLAITLTCAANAVGAVPAGAYAEADGEAARAAFAALGRLLGQPGERLAAQALDAAASKVTAVVDDLLTEHRLGRPALLGVGGGAGALVPEVARRRRLDWRIPPDAEIISSIGDALSLVRVTVERSLVDPSPEQVLSLHREAERGAIDAGADPETLQIESETEPERRILRVSAHGPLALLPDTIAGAAALEEGVLEEMAADALGSPPTLRTRIGPHLLFTDAAGGRFVVVDERGTVDASGSGTVLLGTGTQLREIVRRELAAASRRLGPIAVAPAVRVLRGRRLVDLSLLSDPDRAIEAALEECSMAGDDPVAVTVSRS